MVGGLVSMLVRFVPHFEKTFTPTCMDQPLADNGSTAGVRGGRDDDLIHPSLRWVSCRLMLENEKGQAPLRWRGST
jgi:hypothetical protein